MKDPQAGMDYHELQVKLDKIRTTTTKTRIVQKKLKQSQPMRSAGKHRKGSTRKCSKLITLNRQEDTQPARSARRHITDKKARENV